jgi:integrase
MTVETIETDPLNTEAEIKTLEALVRGPATRSPRAAQAVILTVPLPDVIDAFVKEKTSAGAWTDKTRQEWISLLGRYSTHCEVAGSPFMKETARFKADVLIGRLGTRTVNKHISRLSTFFEWAKGNGYTPDNVFDGLAVTNSKAKASDARHAYTPQQVQALLASVNLAADSRHWVPLLGLYTGARINEPHPEGRRAQSRRDRHLRQWREQLSLCRDCLGNYGTLASCTRSSRRWSSVSASRVRAIASSIFL